MKRTLLKKENWGLLTITALLSTFLFPPYFVHLMTVAALTEFAHLYTTRLTRHQQERMVAFEKEFREGYRREREGRREEALRIYRALEEKYADFPQAARLATLRIRELTGGKAKPPESSRSKKKRRT